MSRLYINRTQYTTEIYHRVVELVVAGLTVQQACQTVNMTSKALYDNMTIDQKLELDIARVTNTKYGIGSHYKDSTSGRLEEDCVIIYEAA